MSDLTKEILGSIRRAVALQLWQLGAVKVNLDQPFELTSGNYSPIYLNCRQLISTPAFVDVFAAATRILADESSVQFDAVAGGETAGIPFAAFLARSFGVPMLYVRKSVKEHGTGARVEGRVTLGARVLLVEDLITDAGSKIGFIGALREVGTVVEDVLVVFDRLQGGKEALSGLGIRLHAVTDMTCTLREVAAIGCVSDREIREIQAYLESPAVWHAKRGLAFIE